MWIIALLIAILTAFCNGARDIRTSQYGAQNDEGQVIIDYVAPNCPRWDDEPCYVIIDVNTLYEEDGP